MKVAMSFLFVMSLASFAAASDCRQLRQELLEMQRAQQLILASLVGNHETFASSIEEFSMVYQSGLGGERSIGIQMNKTAKAFRERGLQGKKTASKLNNATGELFARVADCLK